VSCSNNERMISTHSKEPRYQVLFTNGARAASADAPVPKGGQGEGFGPHELVEASLATCINMWIRMQADKLGIAVGVIDVAVTLKRDHPDEALFESIIKIDGVLSDADRATLLNAAADCPVKRTLSKKLLFRSS